MGMKKNDMRIGILYAMENEAHSFLDRLGACQEETVSGCKVYRAGENLSVCVGGIGKVNSAMSAQMLIDRCGAERVINVGCAGALTDLPTGQLVLGLDCVQHDMDTSILGDPPGFVSTVNCVRFPCADVEQTRAYLSHCGYDAAVGTVATGDWFGRDFARARWVADTFDAALCEMEACAAAQVCLRNGVPFQAFKVVSDHLFSPSQDEEFNNNVGDVMVRLNDAVYAYVKQFVEIGVN